MADMPGIFGRRNFLSWSHEEHIEDFDKVLSVLWRCEIYLKLRKCFFVQLRVDCMGHVISPGILAMAQRRIDAIRVDECLQHLAQVR